MNGQESTPITPEWLIATGFRAAHGGKWIDFSNNLFVYLYPMGVHFELYRESESDEWVKIVDLEGQEHLLEVYQALRIQLP